MKRPIIGALLFVIAGILLGQYEPRIVLFCVCALTVLCFCLYKRFHYGPVFVFVLFAVAGMLRVQISLHDRLNYGEESVSLYGIVQDTGWTSAGNQKLTVVVSLDQPDDFYSQTARITVYTRPGQYAEIGQLVEVTGKLQPLNHPRNPGEYNEFLTQRAYKIDGKVFAERIESYRNNTTLTVWLYRFRDRLAAVYEAILPEREASIMKSVMLGDKAGVEDETAALYRLAGVYHLLCISGLHIAILMMAIQKLLSTFMNKRSAGLFVLAIMLLYCLLTGASVSTVRAVTMCGVAVLARILFREYDLLASTSFACITLLLYEPLYLYNAGFQLSFGAVFGIAVLTTPMEHALTWLRLPLKMKHKNMLASSIAATMATAPLLSYHFYIFSPYSLFVNLIILPTASVLVIFGLLSGLLGLIWLPAATFTSGIVYYLLRFYDMVCRFFTSLPSSAITTGCPGWVVCFASFGVMLTFAYTFNGFGDTLKRRAVTMPVTLLVLAVCIAVRRVPSGLTAMVLDAGQGDYCVITAHSYTYVIGSGTVGADILSAYLDRLGIQQADGWFVTGAAELKRPDIMTLMREGRFKTLYIPVEMHTLANQSLFEGIDETANKWQVVYVNSDETILCGKLSFCFHTDSTVNVVYGGATLGFPLAWLETLHEMDMQVYSTVEDGAAMLRSNGKQIQVYMGGRLP